MADVIEDHLVDPSTIAMLVLVFWIAGALCGYVLARAQVRWALTHELERWRGSVYVRDADEPIYYQVTLTQRDRDRILAAVFREGP